MYTEDQAESRHGAADTGWRYYLLDKRKETEKSQSHRKYNLCFFLQGTLLLPNLHSVVYDAEHWETPWKFNPNHFLDLDGNFVNKEAFLPFSAGNALTFQHSCSSSCSTTKKTLFLNSNILKAF